MSPRGFHRRPGRFPVWWLLALAVLFLAAGLSVRFLADSPASTRTEANALARRAGPSVSPTSPTATLPPSPAQSSPTPPVLRGALVFHGTGDVNVDPNYIPNFREHGYAWAWSGMRGLFKRDDLTVINLECAVSNRGRPVPKEFNFRCDPAALPAMRKAGVEVANLGNNHGYDYGPDALVDSRRNLLKNDIAPVGAGRNAGEAVSAAMFDIEGWKVAVVGFDKVVDPWPTAVAGPDKPGTAAGHDEDAMVAAVRAADRQADIVIVAIHWGVELDTTPRAADVDLGHRLIDAGADVIFGHHSHRLQPMGVYKGRPIFYSLGNFVWPRHSTAGATTAVAEVTVSPKGQVKGRLIPAFIETSGHPILRGT